MNKTADLSCPVCNIRMEENPIFHLESHAKPALITAMIEYLLAEASIQAKFDFDTLTRYVSE